MKQVENNSGQLNIFAIGLAMFSMFFGSGNIIFPVLIGQASEGKAGYAIAGLLITAVFVPFVGVLSLSLFDGDYLKFFKRLGKIPGWAIVICIMGLIGPFGVIPRCIVIAHGSFSSLSTEIPLSVFSLMSCIIIFFCTFKRNNILNILGLILTPVLLVSLLIIIVKGLLDPSAFMSTDSIYTNEQAFLYGLLEGYNTMDLFAAFMFSNVILQGIKKSQPNIVKNPKRLTFIYMKASGIGLGLLAIIYIGMCYVSATHSQSFTNVSADLLLNALTFKILGPYAGLVVCLAVSLACLTTAITLSLVFTEFICKHASQNKLPFKETLAVTLLVSFLLSTLKFTGIQSILVPILQVSLPALMVLTFINLLYKSLGFTPVKTIVALTFVGTIAYHLF